MNTDYQQLEHEQKYGVVVLTARDRQALKDYLRVEGWTGSVPLLVVERALQGLKIRLGTKLAILQKLDEWEAPAQAAIPSARCKTHAVEVDANGWPVKRGGE